MIAAECCDHAIAHAKERPSCDESCAHGFLRINPELPSERADLLVILALEEHEDQRADEHHDGGVGWQHDAKANTHCAEWELALGHDAQDLKHEGDDCTREHRPRCAHWKHTPELCDTVSTRGNEFDALGTHARDHVGNRCPLLRTRHRPFFRDVILDRNVLVPVRQEEDEEQRRRRECSGENTDAVTKRLLTRFRAEHVARLDVHQQVRCVRCNFRRHTSGHEIRSWIRRRHRAEGELCDLRE